jgi:hypothetical protein
VADLRISNVRYNTGMMHGYQLYTVVASEDTLYLFRGLLDEDVQPTIKPITEGAPLFVIPIVIVMSLIMALLTLIARRVRIKQHNRELVQIPYAQLAKKSGNVAIPRATVIEVNGPDKTEWRNQNALAMEIKTAMRHYKLLCVVATPETAFTDEVTIDPKAKLNELQQLKAWLQGKELQVEQPPVKPHRQTARQVWMHSKEQRIEQSSPHDAKSNNLNISTSAANETTDEKLDSEGFLRDFQEHYGTHYSALGHEFQDYLPAYQYGVSLAHDRRYTDLDWVRLEPRARLYWEQHFKGAWDAMKDAVAYAWNRAKATT